MKYQVFILLLSFVHVVHMKFATQHQKQLLKHFSESEAYNKELIPLTKRSGSDKMIIEMSVALESVVTVNEKEQYMISRCIMYMSWNDSYLRWNASHYQGVDEVSMPPSEIWKPDVVLLNVLDDDSYMTNLDESTNRVVVNSNGNVEWKVRKTMRTSCPINVRDFPFDTQKCSISMASWSYDADTIEFQFNRNTDSKQPFFRADEGTYVTNNAWSVTSLDADIVPAERTNIPTMNWRITLNRKTLFYKVNLIMPTAVLAFILTLTFILPADSGERLGMSITLVLSQVVFMLVVADMIPKSSEDVPIVGIFFLVVFFAMVLQIIVLCFAMKCYHKNSRKPPVSGFLRSVVLNKLSYHLGVRSRKTGNLENGRKVTVVEADVQLGDKISAENRSISPILERLEQKIDALAKKLEDDDESETIVEDWRTVGETLDRIMFVVFLLILIIITIICFI